MSNIIYNCLKYIINDYRDGRQNVYSIEELNYRIYFVVTSSLRIVTFLNFKTRLSIIVDMNNDPISIEGLNYSEDIIPFPVTLEDEVEFILTNGRDYFSDEKLLMASYESYLSMTIANIDDIDNSKQIPLERIK